jgi:hypothetical protein
VDEGLQARPSELASAIAAAVSGTCMTATIGVKGSSSIRRTPGPAPVTSAGASRPGAISSPPSTPAPRARASSISMRWRAMPRSVAIGPSVIAEMRARMRSSRSPARAGGTSTRLTA